MQHWTVLTAAAVLIPATAAAQNGGSIHPGMPRSALAVRRAQPILLDGRLDEEAWRAATPATGFIQSQPNEGQPATQPTEVYILFDDDALWIGARMLDSLGAAGVRTRLARRDSYTDSDDLTIVFDTFHDHLGRAQFSVNPSGVKGDAYGPGGSFTDPSWDPVWQVETRMDSLGWTAEFRIPLSQLRFPRDSSQTWGMQIVRTVSRLNERSHWAFWRLNEAGGPNRYGHLEGLELGTARPRGLELLPYLVGQSSNYGRVEEGNPFSRDHESLGRTGLDLTYRLTSNLTLAATVNPDFGQVEVDPAVVNLGVFETFFSERRPFFVEGAGLFRFGGLSCYSCSNASGLSMLHSRRIGRAPQGGAAAAAAGPYTDLPDATTILGAAKITGRTRGGWSLGVLDAVTARERAPVQRLDGSRVSVEVEPFTNYFAARLARDIRGGRTQLRLMGTSVFRDLGDSALADRLNRRSEVLGAEAESWFRNRRYRLVTMAAFSRISGDTGAVLRAQLSSARYFQRPDREQGTNGLFTNRYDPSLTSMRGYAAYARFAKEGGDWLFDAQANVRSPGFEANDLAFNTRSDFLWLNGNLVRRWTRPTSWYRNIWASAGAQTEFNYDGDRVNAPQLHGFVSVTWANYWNSSVYAHRRSSRFDDRLARGGPTLKRPEDWFLNWSGGTDSRRALVLNAYGWVARNPECAVEEGLGVSALVRPAPNFSVSVGPNLSRSVSRSFFVTSLADSTAASFYGRRYVFSDLDQRSLSMDTRISVTFSPTLSLETYIQPLIVAATYSRFKEFVRPRTTEKLVYGEDAGTISELEALPDGRRRWTVDPDGAGPAGSFTITDPSFNFRSLRGNAVLRWEYRPGSTLYLVWTQSRSASAPRGDLDLGRDMRALGDSPSDNVFLVKISYWLGL